MQRCWYAIGAALALAMALVGMRHAPARAQVPARIDPVLSQVLAAAGPLQRVEAVVTFNQYPGTIDLAAVSATGVQVLQFRALPMVGVRGTPAQISNLFGLPGVRSVYYNRQLGYFLNESVPLIGADRVATELGITGRGVGIAIIDTGIDGTHPDLPFGSRVIQNVKVGPDLFGAGPSFIENLPTTDTTSGHGTHVASTVGGTGAALESFDSVLTHGAAYGIRVISNS